MRSKLCFAMSNFASNRGGSASLLMRPILKGFGLGPAEFEQPVELLLRQMANRAQPIHPSVLFTIHALWDFDHATNAIAHLRYALRCMMMGDTDTHNHWVSIAIQAIIDRFIQRNVLPASIQVNAEGLWLMGATADYSTATWYSEFSLIIPFVVSGIPKRIGSEESGADHSLPSLGGD